MTRRLSARDHGRPLLDLAGNDYHGLSTHPAVVEAAVAATRRFGAGAGASRLVSGTVSLHGELESALARFCGSQAALVFSTGYHANLGVVSGLSSPGTLIVSDAHVHASLIDGCRLARGTVAVAPHNDVAAIERLLAARTQQRALVLIETIYSVLGDAAPVADLAEVCRRHGAVLVADEAHAIGVAGRHGRGLLAEFGLAGRTDVIATMTLSKSLGSQGGAVVGSASLREHLINRARTFIYDTGLAPAATGGALAALELIESEPVRVERVRFAAAVLAEACGVDPPAGAVLSMSMPGPRQAVAAVAAAASRGVRIGCFRPPSTPDRISRLRFTAHGHHSDEELGFAAKVLREVVTA
ncbi:MAG: 8-amino-7-oxononanoate synthase [Actinobacteria bacterium]|nr:8-amino-7-oxononanoate synthase [Actinomycetota bacterium]MBW3651106.1 8-amino-7-oxononanoate synthase [Actinomycetota bacterium]